MRFSKSYQKALKKHTLHLLQQNLKEGSWHKFFLSRNSGAYRDVYSFCFEGTKFVLKVPVGSFRLDFQLMDSDTYEGNLANIQELSFWNSTKKRKVKNYLAEKATSF